MCNRFWERISLTDTTPSLAFPGCQRRSKSGRVAPVESQTPHEPASGCSTSLSLTFIRSERRRFGRPA